MKYRAEIDGLRAIAVVPVILFHAGFERLAGGFVGVDVFFVISGYLITSILLSEKERGIFSLVNFYHRRARRILPALFLVIVACVPFAWALMAPGNMTDFAKSVQTISIFGSNILFAQQANGYFAVASDFKPLLHTWSLAVEEQFYFLFPLFLLLTWRLDAKHLACVLSGIAIISFAAAQWGAVHSPAETFYLAHARAWELLLGGLLAVLLRGDGPIFVQSIGIPAKECAAAAGLALIGYAIFVFDRNTPYPGYFALAPTVGTSLVIVFGTAGTRVSQLLSTRFLVAAGRVSYSVYLWHQPVFVFYRLRNSEEPGTVQLFVLIMLSFALAFLTWRFVEMPFRRGEVTRAFSLGVATIGATLFVFGTVSSRDLPWGPAIAVSARLASSLTYPTLRTPCNFTPTGVADIQFCLVGDKSALNKIALFGDSHTEALLPVMDEAGQELGLGIVHVTLGGCPGLLGVYVLYGNVDPCHDLARRQFEYIRNNRIRKIFLASRWTLYTDGDYGGKSMYYLATDRNSWRSKEMSRIAFLTGLERTIESYRQIDTEIVIVAQVPQQLYPADQLYYQLLRNNASSAQIAEGLQRMAVPVEKHNKLQEFSRSAFSRYAATGKIMLINFDSIFCDLSLCRIGSEDESFYFDTNHLSSVGAKLLRGEVGKYVGER